MVPLKYYNNKNVFVMVWPGLKFKTYSILSFSVADPGSGAFLTHGSGIRNRFFPDPGSLAHIFESLVTIFWVKSSIPVIL